ncbi:ermin [Gopherus flavomarginatus]|uniref:ermin n=1 Tax=Gopherus flavomarginatus TaxID=286002 RepID=UPI0021CC4102|nr:ermin [Gopherus flavomarginatus]XP_050825300.1 ermin [Gopherus flavomarginatus]
MTEEVPIASSILEYNGNVPPEKTQLQVIDIIDEIAKSVGTVPCENSETRPEAPLKKENQEDNKNSVEDNTICGALDGEKQCEEKQEENNATLEEGSADIPSENTRKDEEKSREGPCEEIIPVSTKECEITRQEERNTEQPQEETATHANEAKEFQTAGAQEEAWMLEPKKQIKADTQLEDRENAEEEEEEEAQLIESKKENGGQSPLKKQENDREECSPTSPSFNFQGEKPEEQPGSGKKNDISRHSYSRYNTISYRKIRKGNTKQRIDEFESMMHL